MVKGEGWRFFAAAILGITGLMRLFDALWAFTYGGNLPDNLEGALFGHNLHTYGWVYLVLGLILVPASFGVLIGSQLSRWIGIFAGGLMAVTAIWWMPYYPVWSLTYIVCGVLVIFALTMYGDRESVGPVEA